jgi:hypothetical protein
MARGNTVTAALIRQKSSPINLSLIGPNPWQLQARKLPLQGTHSSCGGKGDHQRASIDVVCAVMFAEKLLDSY